MKPNLLKTTFCAGLLCAAALTGSAAGLQRADVMSNPAWLLHLDCDLLRPTTIGKYVLSEMDKPEAKTKLSIFQAIFGFDLRDQLHGVTLYGPDQSPQNAVLLLYADFEASHLVELAKAADDSRSSLHNGHDVYSWADKNKALTNGALPRTYAAIQGKRVVFGQSEASVGKALDVLDGLTPSLAGGNAFPQFGAAGDKHFVEAAARKMDLPGADPNSMILKLSKAVQLAAGEENGQFQASLMLQTDRDEVATQVLTITQGLIALSKLQQDKPEASKIADAIVLKQDGASLTGTLTLPAASIVELMKADAARKTAQASK